MTLPPAHSARSSVRSGAPARDLRWTIAQAINDFERAEAEFNRLGEGVQATAVQGPAAAERLDKLLTDDIVGACEILASLKSHSLDEIRMKARAARAFCKLEPDNTSSRLLRSILSDLLDGRLSY